MKDCAQCGVGFTPNARTVSRQRFCSVSCQKKWYWKRDNPSIRGSRRRCQRCGVEFTVRNGPQLYCSTFCRRAAARDKVPQRWRHAKSRYGLTQEQVESKIVDQGGCCAICGIELSGAGLDRDSPQLDHCHVTGLPRDILCRLCNTGLGNFKDDPDLVEKALKYLRDWMS